MKDASRAVGWVAATCVLLAVACGGSDKKTAEEPEQAEEEGPATPPADEYMVPQETLDALQAFLIRERKYMARCWGKALDAEEVPENDSGRVTVAFTIETSGSVGKLEITDVSHNSNTLKECVLAKAKRWTFDKLERPLEYSFTFGFQGL